MGVWEKTSFAVLIKLCGDVQPNPGPADVYPCSVCGEPVLDNDKAVFCDSCNLWTHVACDPSLSDELYDCMVQNPSSDLWYCSVCSPECQHCDPPTTGGTKYFSCVCLNARSILPKRFDLFAYICCHQIDILAVTETFLDSSISDAEICPSNYVVFRRDRSRHGGGVLIIVRDDLKCLPRNDLNCFCNELLWLEISTSIGPLLFGVFYRPPSQSVADILALNNCLLSIARYPIILCGDFNVPTIDWSVTFPTLSSPVANTLCDLVRDNFLQQLVLSPTRENNLLDLVLTNQPDLILDVTVVDNLPLTDHDAVKFTLCAADALQTPCKRTLYNYKRANLSSLLDTLSHIPWTIIESANDIEDSWQQFKDLFLTAVEVTVPRVRWRQKKLKHWFSYDTIHHIRQKRRLYLRIKSSSSPSALLLLKYRRISNLVRHMTRSDTKVYAEKICQHFHDNPRKFWNWINSSKGRRNPIPPLLDDNISVADDRAKANIFNHYFHSVFTREDMSSFDTLKDSTDFYSPIISTVEFSPPVVCAYLQSLNVSKACGPDLIPAFLLKYSADIISYPLTYLFNKSMSTGTLPKDWVSANVVPVYKRGNKQAPSNYRPISLTSIVIKTMERMIHSELMSTLEAHHLISTHQYGFRRGHSTSHLLLETVNDWAKVLQCRDSCHCLLLDYAKAFDSVPHQRLLLKLQSLGVHDQLLKWICSFLTTRSQRVVINGQFSEWLSVDSGVPQGSILGPLLFILYVDDIRSVVQTSSLRLFADDVCLYAQISSDDDCLKLQNDLSRIYNWSTKWQLKLNPQKCDALNISNKRSPVVFNYFIGSSPISWSKKVKYLGIIFNSTLKWHDQCHYVVSKATQCLNRLRRAMYGCTSAAKAHAYKAIVRPCLEYACTVWSPYAAGDIKAIESVQRRSARWIKSSYDPILQNWTKSSESCISELGWPLLHSRRKYFSVLMVYSILKGAPIAFLKYFQFNSLPTRTHPLTLALTSSTINAFRHSFFVAAPFLWNSIPHAILSEPNKNLFKSKLRHFLYD